MPSQSPIQGSHIRIARPTNDITALRNFYINGLGFSVVSSFTNHNGFDGLMLGFEGMGYHLEFTKKHGHEVPPAPTQDNLLVFYLPDSETWQAAVSRMQQAGYEPVKSFNPYWDPNGKTFEDPDGYRVVLQNAAWTNKVKE